MRILAAAVITLALAGTVAAQPVAEPPLADTRVGVDTLVREDIFAGFMGHDMVRFERGEHNLDTLLTLRPQDRPEILGWQGGALLFRAVLAREAGKPADYQRLYKQADGLLTEAVRLGPQVGGVNGVVGGVVMLWADRLAPADRLHEWQRGYDAFQTIKAGQYAIADKLPPHISGELMAGLVQTAQRTGHTAEMNEALDKMLVVTKGTPYEAGALAWKADPQLAVTGQLGCKSCHDAGRLAPSLARLAPKAG